MDSVVSALSRVVRFKEVEISPDGGRVAWVESVPSEDESRPTEYRIQVVERSKPEAPPMRITASAEATLHVEKELAWSPDGRQLAFLSDAEKEDQEQLYVADVAGGKVRKLTTPTGQLSNPRWSPDGRSIAVLLIEGDHDVKGPTGPAARETGVMEEDPAVRRIAVVGVADGRSRVVSPADLFIHEYAWSPDSQRFAAIAAPPPGDANWWVRIDTWMLPYFGASVYDEPAIYARSSPMDYIKQVRTPTLVVHGERDAEVPVTQGREFYKGLKALGVKTQMIVYPDEGHGFRKPEHTRDRLRRTVEWFDTYMAPAPAPKVDATKR